MKLAKNIFIIAVILVCVSIPGFFALFNETDGTQPISEFKIVESGPVGVQEQISEDFPDADVKSVEADPEAWLKDSLLVVDRLKKAQSEKEAENVQRLNFPAEGSEKTLPETDAEKNDSETGVFQGKFEKGDTIGKILDGAGALESGKYAAAVARVFSLRSFRAGQPYVIFTDPESGKIKRFEYEVNDNKRLVVDGDEIPTARIEDIEYIVRLETVECAINDSLFQAVADIGESPQLALRLVELFGSEINFIRDIQEGDSFSAVIEKRYREGEYKGYGKILAARFNNDGKTWEAFLFRDVSGNAQYYNAKGENLRKTLLQAPLAVTRVTSRFSSSRKHPVLGYSRPHLGTDYGAPTGTPVKAVGDGIVKKRGWGGGFGNQVIIAHSSGLESSYAHMSGFARGVRQGQRVRQGQVIGFVGSTGLSTGPHLDFRLSQNGRFINPLKAINPRGAPVPPVYLASFKKFVELNRGFLDGGRLPENYTLDSVLPKVVASGATGGDAVEKGNEKTGIGRKKKAAKRGSKNKKRR